MKYFMFLILLGVFTTPVSAEDSVTLDPKPKPSSTKAEAQAVPTPKPELSNDICHFLNVHEQVDGADYIGGVDVYGDPVVTANLMGHHAPLDMPVEFSFDVTVNLAEYTGITVPEGVEGNARFGRIHSYDDVLYFNDQALLPEQEQALRSLCSDEMQQNADDTE